MAINKKIFSWALYDWANSVFFTTVMAGFFPVFFKQYWSGEANASVSTERLGWILSISGFLLAVVSPTLGVISDKKGLKKKLLFITMFVGVACTIGFYFVGQGQWAAAAVLYGTGLFMCSASCVFYDSLMVSVCRHDQLDFVSALGFAFGYLGGGVLFLLNVLMYLNPHWFGIPDQATAVKLSFITVGIWWFLFTIPLMLNVPEPTVAEQNKGIIQLTKETFSELKHTVQDIYKDKNLFYFIFAYWFYIDGVFTVMSMAVDFGMSLGFDSSDLIKALLITQFVGFPCAYLFGHFAKKFSNRNLIMLCLAVYVCTIIGASLMTEAWHFYVLAAVIGFSQGGVQALSRSLFAQLIPREKAGEYFGFFNLLGKFASFIGPALVAVFARFTGDARKTILSLLILILFGAYWLAKVKKPDSV